MVTTARWQMAQSYERGYWESQAQQIADGAVPQFEWYKWRADQLCQHLDSLGLHRLTGPDSALLEIGCGPIGVASFFAAGERTAVDPLNEFYGANPVLSALRDPRVSYRVGMGEELPCETGHYDLVVMENCIDHVRDTDAVMSEIRRVLRPDGVLYLTVNCRTSVGFGVHRMLSRLGIDAGHPHTFTPRRVESLVPKRQWQVLWRDVASYRRAFTEDLTSPGLRPRIKALLGTSEFVASVIARRVD